MSDAEARRKVKPRELARKKKQAVLEKTSEPEPGTAANDFRIDYKAAARDSPNRVRIGIDDKRDRTESQVRTRERESSRKAPRL